MPDDLKTAVGTWDVKQAEDPVRFDFDIFHYIKRRRMAKDPLEVLFTERGLFRVTSALGDMDTEGLVVAKLGVLVSCSCCERFGGGMIRCIMSMWMVSIWCIWQCHWRICLEYVSRGLRFARLVWELRNFGLGWLNIGNVNGLPRGAKDGLLHR